MNGANYGEIVVACNRKLVTSQKIQLYNCPRSLYTTTHNVLATNKLKVEI